MLFKAEHVNMIKEGEKTATRRDWSRWQVKVDGRYPVQTEMFQKKEDCEAFIQVYNRYKEKFKDMDEEDVIKEGYSSLEEFKEVWKRINGEYPEPGQEIYVVEFEYIGPEIYKLLEDLETLDGIEWTCLLDKLPEYDHIMVQVRLSDFMSEPKTEEFMDLDSLREIRAHDSSRDQPLITYKIKIKEAE